MTIFDNFWQLMTIYDSLWQLVTTFDSLWQLLTAYDNFWQLMKTFDNLWQLMTAYDNFWQLLTSIDNFWQLLTTFDNFWHLLTSFDIFWHLLTTYTWTLCKLSSSQDFVVGLVIKHETRGSLPGASPFYSVDSAQGSWILLLSAEHETDTGMIIRCPFKSPLKMFVYYFQPLHLLGWVYLNTEERVLIHNMSNLSIH